MEDNLLGKNQPQPFYFDLEISEEDGESYIVTDDNHEGGEIFWRRRQAYPYEIVCCRSGRLPLGAPPYDTMCQAEGCKQGKEVALNGKNVEESQEMGQNKVKEEGDKLLEEPGRCVQGYPQPVANPDEPRIAYWKCKSKIGFCCTNYFEGCGRDLCDLHTRKFTVFKFG